MDITWDRAKPQSQAWRWSSTVTSWHLCRDLSATPDLFSRSREGWAQTLHMWYRASADKPCFDLSRLLKIRVAREMHIKSRRKDLCMLTHSTNFPSSLVLSYCQSLNAKSQLTWIRHPAIIQDSTGNYGVPLGCSQSQLLKTPVLGRLFGCGPLPQA